MRENRLTRLRNLLAERITAQRATIRQALETDKSLPYDHIELNDKQLILLDTTQPMGWRQRISALTPEEQLEYIQDVKMAQEHQQHADDSN